MRMPKRIAETIEIGTPPEPREDTPIKLVFGVEDIAHAQSRAAELGGAMNERGWEFEGIKVRDGHDPEGKHIPTQADTLRQPRTFFSSQLEDNC